MTSLLQTLDQFGDQVEADLAPIVDLRDFYRPGGGTSQLTPRRLLMLIHGLPADSTLWAAIRTERKRQTENPIFARLRRGKERFDQLKREASSG